MNLDLDQTQELLRDTVREYLRSEVPLDRIRALERDQRWDDTLWKALCGQGWLGLPFAEERGGGGGSLVDAGVLVEELARLFDQLVVHLAESQPEKLRDGVVRRRLAELALDLHEHRALALRNAWIISKGGTPIAEASMAKVSGTELRTRIANTAMDLLGRYGALSKESGALAPAEGRMEWAYRISPIFRFGGGTNEVMRDIIAGAGLGLPR